MLGLFFINNQINNFIVFPISAVQKMCAKGIKGVSQPVPDIGRLSSVTEENKSPGF